MVSYFTIHGIDVKEAQGRFLNSPDSRSPDIEDSNMAIIFQPFLRDFFSFIHVHTQNLDKYVLCFLANLQFTEKSKDPLDCCLMSEVCVHVVSGGVPTGQGPLRPG